VQFVSDGPDIPDALLLEHEEGRVVFFCGAGVSYPAGLPGFKGLVEDIYKIVSATFLDNELRAFNKNQYDATLDLLERRLPGERVAVRRALAKRLKPDLSKEGATDTHTALLHLARTRDGVLRLVTTNFDRVFEDAAKGKQPFQIYSAPMLPVPKSSRWDGLVYLHGRLPEDDADDALNRLVVTSGDFGLAYLTERWAARFVSDLFRNYVICFVGYSIDDPVMRYMMDALAADRRQGEKTPTAWAFGQCSPGDERAQREEWEAKGVTPILYHVEKHDHGLLHRSIQAWGETHRDGVLGKERIVVNYASARPSASTRQDDFVGRMLWALCDKSGRPARIFAEFAPAPSLDWLINAFSEERYAHGDLARFGVIPSVDIDEKLRFSLIDRPSPYRQSPWMTMLPRPGSDIAWDKVMNQLALWLVRHLNDPQLIYWIAGRRAGLGRPFAWLVERQLEKIATLEAAGKEDELAEMLANSSNAIPSTAMRKVWNLFLSGRVKNLNKSTDLYTWRKRFAREGLSASKRLALRELLSPKVHIQAPFRWPGSSENAVDSESLRSIVECEVVLNSEHVYSALGNHLQEDKSVSISLLRDFEHLLRDTLDLFHELEKSNALNDRSHWDLPSISEHWQNRRFNDWTFLAESLRDSWEALNEDDSDRAARVAESWFGEPYPMFKRLALHGASRFVTASISWVHWLVADDGWWLWSIATRREVCRLLVLRGARIEDGEFGLLQAAVLAGPPRRMFSDGTEEESFLRISDNNIWLFLSKLQVSGATLGMDARTRLMALSATHPEWRFEPHEREEFTHWMSGSGDPDFKLGIRVDVAPRKWKELALWLELPPKESNPFDEDTWEEVCRTRVFAAVLALRTLANKGQWPAERWRSAFHVWYDEKIVQRSWRVGAALVTQMPSATLLEISDAVSSWLESVSKSIREREELFIELCTRFLELPLRPESGMTSEGKPIDEPVMEAINHPVGHVANALINFWFKSEPSDGDLLPEKLRPVFTAISETGVERHRHGRVLLCTHAISFFRVDQAWSQQHLVPLFSWSNPEEAKSAWEGFLWSPRLYQPFFKAIKQDFLATAGRYDDLGKHKHQFATLLTYSSLEPMEGFNTGELRDAVAALPQEGLEDSARALSQALEGAAEQREEYWKNRIVPFWRNIWPKSREHKTARISDSLANLALNAGTEFPAALDLVCDWLVPIEHPYGELLKLKEEAYCRKFPPQALRFLSAIIAEQQWIADELTKCLEEIADANPQLKRDHSYIRLTELCRL
jgi:hypothetical protein